MNAFFGSINTEPIYHLPITVKHSMTETETKYMDDRVIVTTNHLPHTRNFTLPKPRSEVTEVNSRNSDAFNRETRNQDQSEPTREETFQRNRTFTEREPPRIIYNREKEKDWYWKWRVGERDRKTFLIKSLISLNLCKIKV